MTEDELVRLGVDVEALHVYGEDKGWDFIKRTEVLSLLATLRATPVADTAGIDAAWREAEAALPEGWRPVFVLQRGSTDRPLSREWLATAEDVDDERTGRIGSGPNPAAALRALAAALRTPKPEGEPE